MWHFFSLYVIIFLKIKIYKGGLIMPYIPIIPIIIVVLLILLFAFVPMRLWITALASGSHVGIGTLIGMRLRKVPPARIVLPLIQARKAGLQLNTNQLESHYMAGGHVDAVVNALIASSRAGMNIPFEMAAAIDLAGRDVLEVHVYCLGNILIYISHKSAKCNLCHKISVYNVLIPHVGIFLIKILHCCKHVWNIF
jgi:hypothetical protein